VPAVTPLVDKVVAVLPDVVTSPVRSPAVTVFEPEKTAKSPFEGEPLVETAQAPNASKFSMTYEKLGSIENDLAMIKPRLTGADGNGNPFVITADAAIQDAKNPKRARLRKVEADLTTDKNGWINANAANGVVDMKAGSLELNGGIDVFSDSGYTLHSQSALMDLNKWIVDGHSEVTGQGPMGTMRADRFHYDRDSHQLTLDGHVKMTLIGNKK